MSRLPAVIIAAVAIILAGCSSSGGAHSGAPRPAPPSATPVAELISSAASAECAGFARVWPAVQRDFPAGMKPAGTFAVVRTHNLAWSRELDAAARPAAALPEGRNRATVLARDLTGAAFRLGMAALAAQTGQLDDYLKNLTLFLKAMKSVAGRC